MKMLLSEEVEVGLSSRNINYYEDLGYEIPRYKDKEYRFLVKRGTKIKVKIKDLLKTSYSLVEIKCDYCGKIYPIKYKDYINQRNKSIITKDCCNECKQIKINEVIFEKYGVDHISQLDWVIKKSINTCQEKYGVDYFQQTEEGKKIRAKENNPNWKGGKTRESQLLRNTEEYRIWKNKVFHRDKKICQCCGIKSNKNHPHHIYNFSQYPDLRFDVNNGITLCIECHASSMKNSFHNLYGTKNNNYEQLKEYIERKTGGEWNWPYINQISAYQTTLR